MSDPGSKEVQVSSTVSVGTVYDGLVAGTYAEKMYVESLTFQAPQVRPPSLKTVRSYLEAVSDPEADQETDPMLAGVRAIPFRAALPGAGQPQELCPLVDAILEQARQREVSQRLVLLGDPGSGKTPALLNCLRVVALASRDLLDKQAQGQDEKAIPAECVIPVYCSATYLGPGRPLEGQVLDTFNAKLPEGEPPLTLDALTWLLRSCTFKFFVDSLEDLLAEGLREGLQELSRFMELYRRHAYVIGCRTSSYHQQLGPLQSLCMANLAPDDVQKILDSVDPGLYAKVEKNPTALAVARNRSMLERFLVTGEQKILLQTRASLLQATIREQLDPEPGGRMYAGLDRPMVEGLLETLASSMRRAHRRQSSPRQLMDLVSRYLEDWRLESEWRAVVKALGDAELLEWDKTGQGCGFADRSVEDYFAAAALAHDPVALQEVLAEVSDYWWRDVFEILVGLVSDPQALLLELVDRDALVAADCLRFTASAVGESVGGAVIDALVEQMGRESTDRRKFIVERIAECDHPRAPEALLMALQREWSSAVILAATLGLRAQYQQDPDAIEEAEKRVRYQLAYKGQYIGRLVAQFDRNAPADTVETVTRRMLQTRQPGLFRGIAAVGLGLIGTEKARDVLLGTLDDGTLTDSVAWCGVEALTQFKGDAAQPIHDRLVELLGDGEHGKPKWARRRARWVYLLGWVGRAGEETSGLLLQALQDDSPSVRVRAVAAMARLDRVDARESIELVLEKDPNPYVQRKAADALGQIGTLDSLPVLERCQCQERSAARLAMRHGMAAIKQRYGVS